MQNKNHVPDNITKIAIELIALQKPFKNVFGNIYYMQYQFNDYKSKKGFFLLFITICLLIKKI